MIQELAVLIAGELDHTKDEPRISAVELIVSYLTAFERDVRADEREKVTYDRTGNTH